MKVVIVLLLRLTVSREEFYVFSGTKQVFLSTYYVRDWFEPLGVSLERALLQLHLRLH